MLYAIYWYFMYWKTTVIVLLLVYVLPVMLVLYGVGAGLRRLKLVWRKETKGPPSWLTLIPGAQFVPLESQEPRPPRERARLAAVHRGAQRFPASGAAVPARHSDRARE